MALSAAQQWWVRAGGNELNGGGYDATVSGAGTNYSDQDAAQLSIADAVTVGSTTVTSVTGGFTAAMIGNVIRIAGDGYYVITARASTNSITVDRNTGTSAGSNARVGGAHASLTSYASLGNTPILTSPLAPGHTINLRGGGTDDPSSPDYTTTGFWTFPDGNLTTGCITLVGYNGRPHIRGDGLTLWFEVFWRYRHLKFSVSGTNFDAYGFMQGNNLNGGIALEDVYFDQNGQDMPFIGGNNAGAAGFACAVRTWAKNTGSTSAGTFATFATAFHGAGLLSCRIQDQRGWAADVSQLGAFLGNLITNCKHASKAAIQVAFDGAGNLPPIGYLFWRNTIDGGAASGLNLQYKATMFSAIVLDNLFTNNAGYGIDAGSSLGDALVALKSDYNAFYNNTSGDRHYLTNGAHDVDLSADPYTGGGDFSLNGTAGGGVAAKEAAFPGTMPGSLSVGKLDIGAVQHSA